MGPTKIHKHSRGMKMNENLRIYRESKQSRKHHSCVSKTTRTSGGIPSRTTRPKAWCCCLFLTHTAVQVRLLNSKARALLVSEPCARPSRLHFSICACLIKKTTAALRECHRKRAPSTPQHLASRQVLHAHDAYERERERKRARERAENWSFSLLLAYVNLDKI